MTEDLFTPKDVAKIRAMLIKEQKGLCALTGKPTLDRDMVLDHNHNQEQLVRGAINKHSNSLLGRIENLQARYLNHWYPHGLPAFLRACADYLEKPKDKRWRHLGWIRKTITEFNKLKVSEQKQVLVALGQPAGTNLVERRKLLNKAILTRQFSRDTIMKLIKDA